MSAYLIDMEEEYRQVKQDDNEEGQDEDDDQRGEDPQQVLQNTQVVLHLTNACPILQSMEHTHLWTKKPPHRKHVNIVKKFMFTPGRILVNLVNPDFS